MSEMNPSKPEKRAMPQVAGQGIASPMPPPPPPFNTPARDGSSGDVPMAMGSTVVAGGGTGAATLAEKLSGLGVSDTAEGDRVVDRAEAMEEQEEMDDDEDDEAEDEVDLPPEVMKRLYELKALQSEKDIVYEKYKVERAQLERKFASEYGAIHARRAAIVQGRVKHVEDGAAEASGEGGGEEGEDDEEETGVPHFWMQCMLHHEALHDVVCEPDLEALYYLSDVRCVDKDDLLGFTLEFHFDENPYFTNAVLKKRYDTANIMDQGEPLLEGVHGTEIDWKPGRNLCERTIRRKIKLRGARSGETRTVTKVEKTESFFKFFQNPIMYEADDDEEDDEQYNFSFDMDYEVARIFRNHLIPNAVLWFTGEAVSDEEDDDEKDDGDLDDDDVDGDGDGEDDEVGEGAGGTGGIPPKTLSFQAPAGFGAPPP